MSRASAQLRFVLCSPTCLNSENSTAGRSLVGVAPFNHDSGTLKGRCAIWEGRAAVRSALYMATLLATRRNSAIRGFYKHLKAKGQALKVALVACMRKLLTILHSMIKYKTRWSDTSLQTI